MDGLPAVYDPVKLQGYVFKEFYFKVGKSTVGSYPCQIAGASYIKFLIIPYACHILQFRYPSLNFGLTGYP